MKFSRPTLALFAVSILALGAGVVTGTLGARVTGESAAGGSSLSAELGLSPQQHDQMQQIWESVRTTAHQCQEQAQQLQKQRDDQIFAMLSDEQKARYTQITTECVGRISALASQRDKAFASAVAQTEGILSQPQRQMYEQLIQDRLGQRISTDNAATGSQEMAMARP
jgi:hypothetical protein